MESDVIKFRCPQCGKKIGVPAAYAGKRAVCPACHEKVMIQSPAETPFAGNSEPYREVAAMEQKALPPSVAAPSHASPDEVTAIERFWLSMPWQRRVQLLSGALTLTVLSISLMVWWMTRDTWERDNLPRLQAVQQDALQAENAGHLEEAKKGYDEILGAAALRTNQSPVLSNLTAEARANSDRVGAILGERRHEREIAEAAAAQEQALLPAVQKNWADAVGAYGKNDFTTARTTWAALVDSLSKVQFPLTERLAAIKKDATAKLSQCDLRIKDQKTLLKIAQLQSTVTPDMKTGEPGRALSIYDDIIRLAGALDEVPSTTQTQLRQVMAEREQVKQLYWRNSPTLLLPSNILTYMQEVFVPAIASGQGTIADRLSRTSAVHNHFEMVLLGTPDCGKSAYLREMDSQGQLHWELAYMYPDLFHVDQWIVPEHLSDEIGGPKGWNMDTTGFRLTEVRDAYKVPTVIAQLYWVETNGPALGFNSMEARLVMRAILKYDIPRDDLVKIVKHLADGGAVRLRWSIDEKEAGWFGKTNNGELLTEVDGNVYDCQILPKDSPLAQQMSAEIRAVKNASEQTEATLKEQLRTGQTPDHTLGLAAQVAAQWKRSQLDDAEAARRAEARAPKAVADRWCAENLPLKVERMDFVGYFNPLTQQHGETLASVGLSGHGPGQKVAVVYNVQCITKGGFLRWGVLHVELAANSNNDWAYRMVYLDGKELWTY